jgi:NAD(P)-dependent dehydrogenase (short-subunit alcohol dehydrogenase family)
MATYDVADRSAIVTGAGSGIGRATALLLAANGAKVVVQDLDASAAQSVVSEIEAAGGTAVSVVGDASATEVVEETVRAAEELGPLGIGVNNAGIGGAVAPTGDYSDADWEKVVSINLNAVFRGTRAQVSAMSSHGGGAVVNVASILGSVGTAGSPAYVSTKHAVVGLTKTAALEYATAGVRVNSVGPGYIDTNMTKIIGDDPARAAKVLDAVPMARFGRPREIADVALFLASDEASYVTGELMCADGGFFTH